MGVESECLVLTPEIVNLGGRQQRVWREVATIPLRHGAHRRSAVLPALLASGGEAEVDDVFMVLNEEAAQRFRLQEKDGPLEQRFEVVAVG